MAATGYAGAGIGGYSIGNPGKGKPSTSEEPKGLGVERLKRQYIDYLSTKREEIDEQQDSRRFRHGSQWTAEQEKELKARKQPVVTVNRISRKIHGVIGVLSRLKQDPKAYPRTPNHEEGAELATAAIRYVMDTNEWDSTDYFCGEMAAIDGVAGVEINVIEETKGKDDVEVIPFITDSFFYDPRSYKPDFSDARYMGVGKWLDIEEAVELHPDFEEEMRAGMESGSEFTSEPDRDHRWYNTDGQERRIRLVEHWYRHKGGWHWMIYFGGGELAKGESYLKDGNGNTLCKYIAWSAYIDQDGDRYGFVRDLKPLQQETNMRRSKALYTMLGRRILTPKGGFDNIEIARREAARTDGVVVYNQQGDLKPEFDDQARLAESNAQFQFYESAQQDLESFGPNVAISTGEGLERASGRAIHLLQQAGLADLGPFLQSYRAWKIRVYRGVWRAIRQYWKEERWIRVTDNDDLKKFVQINGWEYDEMGFPVAINKVGDLDVDIIIDEGPDTVNQMADAFDTLEVLAQRGAEIPPDVLIELAPLPLSMKKRLLEKMQPKPSEEETRAMELELAEKESDVHVNVANAQLKKAMAYKAYAEANAPQETQTVEQQEDPRVVEAELAKMAADAQATLATVEATRSKMKLDSFKMQSDVEGARQDRQIKAATAQADIENKQATKQKMDMETAMRPYEVENEHSKQGMDFELKREQIRKTPKTGK